MTVKERILSIELYELLKQNKSYAKKIDMTSKLVEKSKFNILLANKKIN